MTFSETSQRIWRYAVLQAPNPFELIRITVWRLRGAKIGCGTRFPRTMATWPHQVRIGRDCVLQPDIFFNYAHFWQPGPSFVIGDRVFVGRGVEFNIQGRIEVGDDALIASGCVFVDHDHGLSSYGPINKQGSEVRPIVIGSNVWIGANAAVLKGVAIGRGAVVGAGAVVTKSIPAGEVWVGNPARFTRKINPEV